MSAKKLVSCLPILSLLLVLAIPFESQGRLPDCFSVLNELNDSLLGRISNWVSPPEKREAAIRAKIQKVASDDWDQIAQMSQQWLSEFHGLKVPLLQMKESLKFNAVRFLVDMTATRSETVPAFLPHLKGMSQEDQLSLFANLKSQIVFKSNNPYTINVLGVLDKALARSAAENIPLLAAFQKTKMEIERDAHLTLESNFPAVYTEALKAWNDRKVQIKNDGMIAYDDELGIPDRFTYELGKRVGKVNRLLLDLLPSEDQAKLKALIYAQETTLEHALHDSHYQQLFDFQFADSGSTLGPVWGFINPTNGFPQYRDHRWWKASTTFSEINPVTGQEERSRITGKTSKNPIFRKRFGPEAERVIYWPDQTERKQDSYGIWKLIPGMLSLNRVSIAETKVDGRVVEVEVRANRAIGEPPTGFYFVVMEDDFVPARRFNGIPIKQACIGCHHKEDDPRIETFNALKSYQEFHESGFRNPKLIKELMDREAK